MNDNVMPPVEQTMGVDELLSMLREKGMQDEEIKALLDEAEDKLECGNEADMAGELLGVDL